MGKQFCLGQFTLEFVPSRGTPLKLLVMATFFADLKGLPLALRHPFCRFTPCSTRRKTDQSRQIAALFGSSFVSSFLYGGIVTYLEGRTLDLDYSHTKKGGKKGPRLVESTPRYYTHKHGLEAIYNLDPN